MHTFLRSLFALFILLLTACSGSSGSSSSTVSGKAVKGAIVNGIVQVYSVDPASQTLDASISTRTDNTGAFNLAKENLQGDAIFLIEVTADDQTSMRCDVITGCTQAASGTTYDFGQLMPVPSGFRMLGLVYKNKAFISPLSHLVVASALALPGQLNEDNIKLAADWVEAALQLPGELLTTPLADITDETALQQLNASEVLVATWGAAFYELANASEWQDLLVNINNLPLPAILDALADTARFISENAGNSLSPQARTLLDATLQNAEAWKQLVAAGGLVVLSAPENITINGSGEKAVLRVQAISETTINYQWYRDGTALQGQNSATLDLASLGSDAMGEYSVKLSNGSGQSIDLSLSVSISEAGSPVEILQHPRSQAVSFGDSFTLNVLASGSGDLSYQWQKNGSVLAGETGSYLHIRDAASTDTALYRVAVENSYGIVYSDFADVSVNNEVSPVQITQQPQDASAPEGANIRLSVAASGGGFLRYQWQKDGQNIDNAVNSELSLNSLTLAQSGSYQVHVSNSQGSVVSSPATVTVLSNLATLTINMQPQDQTLYAGDTASFEVMASSGSSMDYQWFKDGTPLSGETRARLSLSDIGAADEGNYHVTINDAFKQLVSNSARLSVLDAPALQLSWSIPTQRENGEPLPINEIGGYAIEYGTDSQNLAHHVDISGASTTNYRITDLRPGTLYLRMATIDANGIQGNFSGIVSINIP